MEYHFIKDQEKLEKASALFLQQQEIALDLEFDHNSFSYGINLCLAQISLSDGSVYLIDPFEVKDFDPLFEVLADKGIKKVIHSASEDALVIQHLGGNINGIIDTEKIARLVSEDKSGLSDLLQKYFGVSLDKKLQRSNWNLRPISRDLQNYAAQDVYLLLDLKNKLLELAKEKNLFSWIHPLMEDLENEFQKEKKNSTKKIKGYKELGKREKKVADNILLIREDFAKRSNKPPYMILQNSLVLELARNPVEGFSEWKKMKGFSPWAKEKGFYDRYREAQAETFETQKNPAEPNRNFKSPFVAAPKFNKRMKLLEEFGLELRKYGGEEAARLVISKNKMNEISVSGDYSGINLFFLEKFAWRDPKKRREFEKTFS